MDTGPKNSQTMKHDWEKSQVPHWEETFVVLQVLCFAGSWASTENGGGGSVLFFQPCSKSACFSIKS